MRVQLSFSVPDLLFGSLFQNLEGLKGRNALRTSERKDMRNMAFSDSTKDAAHRRAGGQCECTRILACNHGSGRCTAKLGRNQGHFHHRTAQSAGGSDGLANCEHLCVACHRNTGSYGG